MKKSFIQRLLSGADTATAELPAFVFSPEELREVSAEPQRQVLAAEHAHGVVDRTLRALYAEEAELVEEIRVRTEKLRSVRVTINAMVSAWTMLNEDLAAQGALEEPPAPPAN